MDCLPCMQDVDQDILNLITSDVSCHEISLENTSAVFEFRLEKVPLHSYPGAPFS